MLAQKPSAAGHAVKLAASNGPAEIREKAAQIGAIAVTAQTLAQGGLPEGAANRIAIPVSGDDQFGKTPAVELVNDIDFDALVAGDLIDSWR